MMETETESLSRRWVELAETIAADKRDDALQLLHELRPYDVPRPSLVIRRVAEREAQPPSLAR